MSTDIETFQVHQRFKMNSDFWPQARGPPNPSANNSFQSLMDQTNDYHRAQQAQNFHNNNNNNNNDTAVDMKEQLMSQENQNAFGQVAAGFALQQQQQQQQQHQQQLQQPAPTASPGAENSSTESKFNAEKIVNEIQVSSLV